MSEGIDFEVIYLETSRETIPDREQKEEKHTLRENTGEYSKNNSEVRGRYVRGMA